GASAAGAAGPSPGGPRRGRCAGGDAGVHRARVRSRPGLYRGRPGRPPSRGVRRQGGQAGGARRAGGARGRGAHACPRAGRGAGGRGRLPGSPARPFSRRAARPPCGHRTPRRGGGPGGPAPRASQAARGRRGVRVRRTVAPGRRGRGGGAHPRRRSGGGCAGGKAARRSVRAV
ncbi:MAG: hypothetical protein AVDCRST_MAG89-179, partial [uncultured Gemmatimonadetes bacterium]